MKKKLKIFGFFVIFEAIYIPILSIILIYYGPFTTIRDMVVTTAMTTMHHQYIATWFLSNDKIQEILNKNRPQEVLAAQELDAIEVNKNADSGIQIVDVSANKFKGYLMIINDPSRVKLANAPKLGTTGATTSQIVQANEAVGGINAGGFADDITGTGGKPAGVIIEDSEWKTTNTSGSYSFVGLDKNNKMIVSNSMSISNIKQLNLRCAVTFGPVLVLNGKSTIKGLDGGFGIQPRAAIGQKKDGTILLLVIDGRQSSSIGATLKNVQDIFLKYGAYTAYNLDGGASSTMIYDSKLVNKPSDIMGERYVPNAFVVTKAKN